MYVIPDPSICVSHVRVYVSVLVRQLCISLNLRSQYSTRTRLMCIIEQCVCLRMDREENELIAAPSAYSYVQTTATSPALYESMCAYIRLLKCFINMVCEYRNIA